VTLTYAEAEGNPPSSLIAKLPMATGDSISGYRAAQQREPALARRYYERAALEARFYREVDAAPVPRLYYSAVDDARERVVLLLEDLTPGRPGDALHGCSIDEAALVLERMAPFHARWRDGHSRLNGFGRWADQLDARQERYDRNVGVFLERFGDRLPVDVRTLAEGLRSRLAGVVAPLVARDQTLIHGDLHLDNVLFDTPPAGRPVVLDWQTACVGPAALDLVMFMFGSLSVADRRAAEAVLLRQYAAAVGRTVDDLRLDCRLALLSAFAGIVSWLARPDLDELTGRERALADAALDDAQIVTALLDHDVAGLLE